MYKAKSMRNMFLMALSMMLIAGCSEYPSNGELDTQFVRSKAKIVDITGDVYGLEKGATKHLDLYTQDAIETDGYKSEGYMSRVFTAIRNGKAVPEINLVYPSENMPPMKGLKEEIVEVMTPQIKAVRDRVEEERKAANEKVEAVKEKIASIESDVTAIEEASVEPQAKIDKIKDEINAASQKYNETAENGLEGINTLLKEKGYKEFNAYNNPLKKYSIKSYSVQEKPATCPKDRFRFEINLLDEDNVCVYISDISSNREDYGDIASKIESVFKEAYLVMTPLVEEVGKKKGWSRPATGLWAKLAEAEEALDLAQFQAEEKYGRKYTVQNNLRTANYELKDATRELEQVSGEDYMDQQMERAFYDDLVFSDELNAKIEDYREAMRKDVISMLPKKSKLEFDEANETATFSGLEGDLEGYAVVSTILTEERGRRSPVAAIAVGSLLTPEVKKAGKVVVELDKDNFERMRKIENDEEIFEQIFERMEDNPVTVKSSK